MRSIALSSIVVAATLSLVACGGGEATGAAPVQDPTTAGNVSAAPPVSSAAKADLVDTANAAGSFKTLLAAVKAADLESTLRGPGPFTVFAPTDEAFAKLPAGTVEGLLKPENKDKLKAILTYHVVSGRVGSDQAMKLTSAKTVNGKELKLDASGGALHVGKATVVKADVAASNGVIHVVDAVILPE
jgi:transforming growth factor-beta-induced protein